MWTPGPIKAQAPKLLVNMAFMQFSAGPSSRWGICGCGEWHLKTDGKVNINPCFKLLFNQRQLLSSEKRPSVNIAWVTLCIRIQRHHWRSVMLIQTKPRLKNCSLTSSSNCCLDKRVQLFVTTDGELQVTGSDTLHLQVFGGVARQL